MGRRVRCGLIQAGCELMGDQPIEKLKHHMIEKHLKLLEEAGHRGVNIACTQELFFSPYFPSEQDTKWYGIAEGVPEGDTVKLMQEQAKRYGMVIVIAIYEEQMAGVYYNTAAIIDADGTYLGKYRKNHIPHVRPFWEKFYFKPGNLGYPVFRTAYGNVGVYICYDRHFPEGARLLGLNGAEIVFIPSVTVSEYLWKVEAPAHAVANGYFVGSINRIGRELPWNEGEYFGSSYFCDPNSKIIAEGSRDKDEVIIADLDLELITEVRKTWPFFRDRRPETYEMIVDLVP